ncbi:MAG TPA: TetR/AcrR family transcriptional regulator [Actinomycetota bacterium]
MGSKAEQAEATRAELVRVAQALFSERGYEATPIEEVLARAGVSKGALYHHFPNKEALFEAVFRTCEARGADRIGVAVKDASDPLEILRIGANTWLDMTMDPKVRQVSLIDGPSVLGWERWRAIDEEYGFGLVKAVLQAAMDAGLIAEQPLEMLAHMVLAMLGEAALVIARSDDPQRARGEAGEAIDRLISALSRTSDG